MMMMMMITSGFSVNRSYVFSIAPNSQQISYAQYVICTFKYSIYILHISYFLFYVVKSHSKKTNKVIQNQRLLNLTKECFHCVKTKSKRRTQEPAFPNRSVNEVADTNPQRSAGQRLPWLHCPQTARVTSGVLAALLQ